ncbi:MAG TPA: hypothetical protein DCZ94_04825 [Lentisphaeria bacterium]|nr:MAG: hypothetical protein A2X48_01105 [Lentisphaerae bacterium GWF2_49_21]HBC86260.1 hypothetical protein [Lentisphaeria bacterium]
MKTIVLKFRKLLFWSSILMALAMLVSLYLPEGEWLSDIILSVSIKFSIFILWIAILLLPPMFYFRKTRTAAACITEFSSFVFCLTLWFMSVKITNMFVGFMMVALGLLAFGIGCIPFSIFLTWYFGRWVDFEILLVLLLLCVLCRVITHMYFINVANKEDAGPDSQEQ